MTWTEPELGHDISDCRREQAGGDDFGLPFLSLLNPFFNSLPVIFTTLLLRVKRSSHTHTHIFNRRWIVLHTHPNAKNNSLLSLFSSPACQFVHRFSFLFVILDSFCPTFCLHVWRKEKKKVAPTTEWNEKIDLKSGFGCLEKWIKVVVG